MIIINLCELRLGRQVANLLLQRVPGNPSHLKQGKKILSLTFYKTMLESGSITYLSLVQHLCPNHHIS